MKVKLSLSSKVQAIPVERCETALKIKHREIKLINLNLVSDDSTSFNESSIEEQPSASAPVKSPVKLDIRKCFVMRKDLEDSFGEPSRTSTPLPAKSDMEENDNTSDSDLPKPRKEAKKDKEPLKSKKKKPSKKKLLSCNLCSRTFVNENFFNRHLEQHKEGFKCKFCDKTLANKESLYKHETYVHVAQTLHNCGQCSKSFRTSSGLMAHRTLHSSISSEKLYCKYCGKIYALNKSFQRHLKRYPNHDVSNDLKSLE